MSFLSTLASNFFRFVTIIMITHGLTMVDANIVERVEPEELMPHDLSGFDPREFDPREMKLDDFLKEQYDIDNLKGGDGFVADFTKGFMKGFTGTVTLPVSAYYKLLSEEQKSAVKAGLTTMVMSTFKKAVLG